MHHDAIDGRDAPIYPKEAQSPVNDPRVYLAAERTFLAWVRTSVALMGFGFLIARFTLVMRAYNALGPESRNTRLMVSPWLGFAMVCLGVLVVVVAALRHFGYIQALERGVANPPVHIKTSMIVAGMLALVGLAMAINILMI
jgi:putative membrane protein